MDTNKRTPRSSQKDIVEIEPFNTRNEVFFEDERKQLIFFKAERILQAVYLITDHMSDRDILKETLREEALNFFKTTSLALDALVREGKGSQELHGGLKVSLGIKVGTMESLFKIANLSSSISKQNTSLISKEMGMLCKDLFPTSVVTETKKELRFSEDFFSPPSDLITDRSENRESGSRPLSKGHFEKRDDHKGHSAISDKTQTSDRQKKILSKLEEEGEIGIKDIAQSFSGVSEKTLQRDIQTLVKKGIVEKKGRKRWTTYVLNTKA